MAGLWDVLSGIGYALDTPGALARAGIANLADLATGQDRHQGWRASGRDLAYSLGLVGENQPGLDAGDVLGLGLDIAVDPLNLIGGGMVAKLFGKASKAAKTNAASKVWREAGWMPEELAKATKLKTAYLTPPWKYRLMNPEEAALFLAEHSKEPARLLHGTAAPVFEEFAEDVGTGNWLGRGTYFSTDPKATPGYSLLIKPPPNIPGPAKWDWYSPKELEDLKKQLAYLKRDILKREAALAEVEAFRARLKQGEVTQAELDDWLKRRAPPAWLNARSSDDVMETLKSDASFAKYQLLDASDSIRKVQSRINLLENAAPRTMMRYAYSKKPFVFEEPATLGDIRAIAKASPHRSLYFDRLREVQQIADDFTIQKGHAFFASPAHQDELASVLQKQGYDALHHGEDYGAHDINNTFGINNTFIDNPVTMLEEWGKPGLDAHPETVIFDPKNIYQPFVAPAFQQVRRWPARSLAAALLGQEALTGMTQ